ADQVALAIDNAHLLEESRQSLQELQTLYGQQTRSAWQKRLAGESVGYLLSGGQIASLEQEQLLPAGALQSSTKQAGLQAEGRRIIAPVSLRGQNVGSLVFWREEEQEPWSSEDVAMLESLSVQVGLALENARLLEDTQRRAQRESNIREIADKVSASSDLETVLRTAVEELSVALGAGGALVELGLPRQEEK
ncbi:MAG: GAF domain-containing protein, partial [Chloroflexota bacterium]|nr:GAF domain-containing protein [Chloroflexota bacterium]